MAKTATNSDAFNAVAEPLRRDILNYLAMQERPVSEIVDAMQMEQPSVFSERMVSTCFRKIKEK
jgi:DNA-binding transcriptional ArsR family regulator